MGKRSPRLQFTEEERAAPELKKSIRKADKKADRLEKAEAKIPKKTVKRKERIVNPECKNPLCGDSEKETALQAFSRRGPRYH